MVEREFYSPFEVAKILGVNKSTVYAMIKAGALPAMRTGAANTLFRIPKSSVDTLIQEVQQRENPRVTS